MEEEVQGNNMLICRVCLVTNVRMYNILQTLSISSAFCELTGISHFGLNEHICYECAARLRKCQEFRSNCFKAIEILACKGTTEDIERDRKLKYLESPLQLTDIIVCEYNDKEQSNAADTLDNVDANIGLDYEQSYNKDLKYESHENTKHEFHAETNSIAGLLNNQNTLTCVERSKEVDSISGTLDDQNLLANGSRPEEFNVSGELDNLNVTSNEKTLEVNNFSGVFDNSKDINNTSDEFEYQKLASNSRPKVEEVYIEIKNIPFIYDKNILPCDYSTKVEEKKENLQEVTTKKKKRKVTPRKFLTKSKSPEPNADGVPRTFKAPPDKFSQFDAKSFEEYAFVTPMTFEDAKREVELRKESSNYMRCPLKCDLCYRGYGTQSAYNNHMKKHSVAKGKLECEVCHLRFPKLRPYSKHMISCHKRKFSCKMCPYICFSVTQVKAHIKFHKGVNYTCDVCQETFSMPNTMLSHKRIKHPTEVVCALCGSAFATDKGLHAHNSLIHIQETNDKKGPQCVECNVHFATELAWKRHLVLSAKHKVGFGCETCGQAYASAGMLKSHMKLHASEQKPRLERSFPADCTFCSKTLMNRTAYKEHMTVQHADSDVTKWLLAEEYLPCVCEFCGKGFKTPSLLATHQTKHTGERPYKCNICQKTFSLPATLSAHKRSHTPDCRVKCDLCYKIFQSKSALKKHEKISHLNIRPFSCNDCGKSYHNLCEVKYHKQHAHGNVPWPKRDRSKRTKANEEQPD